MRSQENGMRRKYLTSLAILGCSASIACEDGPKQTYLPPAPGAAAKWNNGQDPTKPGSNGSVASATQAFGSSSGTGDNANQICDANQQAAAWAVMFKAPIIVPNVAAGLNLAGTVSLTDPTVTWQGLTIEKAEQINCQATNVGDAFGDGNETDYWGDNQEVLAEYNPATHKLFSMSLFPGYLGEMNFATTATSPYGVASYKLVINSVIQKTDSAGTNPLSLPFNDELYGAPAARADAQKIFDAIYWGVMQTYFPSFTPDPAGVTCFQSGRCILGDAGQGYAYFYVPSIGWGLWVNPFTDPVATNKPNRIDIMLTAIMNYGFANPLVKLDSEGPVTLPATEGTGPKPCALKLGLTFGDFLADCVETDRDATQNPTEFAKLVTGISHNTEDWNFNVPGIDLNFSDSTLAATDVVLDYNPPAGGMVSLANAPPHTLPQPNDPAEEWSADQATLGFYLNDYTPDLVTHDLHGAGQLYTEYRRLVIQHIYQEKGLPLYPENDSAHRLPTVTSIIANCVAPMDASGNLTPNSTDGVGNPIFDPAVFLTYQQAHNCTGIEGLLSPGQPTGTAADLDDRVNIGAQAAQSINPAYAIGMKMGHQSASICVDAMSRNQITAASTAAGYLVTPQLCATGDILSTSAKAVLNVFGNGNVLSMPPDIRDNRFYFKMYSYALIKTLEHAATDGSAATSVDSEPIDYNSFFFDSVGSGQFEIMEYTDRRFASATQPPLDIVFTVDVIHGILDSYDISRFLTRGELAVYSALQATNNGTPVPIGANGAVIDPTGANPPLPTTPVLTNIFGSPLLANGWASYACAITAPTQANQMNHLECNGAFAPVDANGNMSLDPNGDPLLAPYPGAWMPTAFHLGNTPLTVLDTFPFEQQALVSVPVFTNPFDPTTKTGTVKKLVSWMPSQPGIGFDVAVNGVLDQFVQTSALDFTGNTITANVDYNLVADPNNPAKQVVQALAVESADFLGDVFLCQEGNDILTARMYSQVEGIMEWLSAHPSSFTDCGIIVRYSPFDNYVDYITSLTNGVRLGVTQGGGYGRINDAILFVPGQYGNQ